ncbi:MAG TPA: hypothetical protein VGR95_08600 [Thermoanaerobaculia bacterium]|jgi:hypothetical protein|nr:hypothetical protein [Thermoanaerobaculia bacterium]
MSGHQRNFAVCTRNDEYEESLQLEKVYELLDDARAEEHNMVRVIDEEGEDYLYPRDWFLPIDLPSS